MKLRFWIIFAGLAVVWGASFLWIKIALEELSPLGVATFRVGLGTAGLLVACLVKGEKLPFRDPRAWLLFLGPALLNTALPFPLISWAETRISSGLASVLNGTVPLFTFVMAHFFFHDERLTLTRVLGLFCGFLGVVVLASKALLEGGHNSSLLGMASMISAIVLYALANVYAKKYLRGRKPLVTATMALTIAFLILMPWMALTEPIHLPQKTITWVGLCWLGFLGLSTAYVCYFYLVEHWGPSRVSTIAYVFPFFGMLLGIVFLNEVLTWRLGAGAVLIVLALWIINHSSAKGVANPIEGVRDNTMILKKGA